MEKSKLNNFTALRNVLSFLVVLTHFNIISGLNSSYVFFHLSGIAIDMFFCVSGFLIYESVSRKKKITIFYLKRFLRIYPLYFFVIFLQTIYIFLSSEITYDLAQYFLWNSIFFNFLAPTANGVFEGLAVPAFNGSLWTLKNEVAFYLIAPFIFIYVIRYGNRVLLIAYCLSCIFSLWAVSTSIAFLVVSFPAFLKLFFAGIVISVFKNHLLFMKLPFFIFLAAFTFYMQDFYYLRHTVYPLFLGASMFYLVFLCYRSRILNSVDFSYGMYLIHFPIFQIIIDRDLMDLSNEWHFFFLLVLILFLSILLHFVIERPFIRIGKNF